MKGRIKSGAMVGQDFRYFSWDDPNQVFDFEKHTPDRYKATTFGYGVIRTNQSYGNGALFVKKSDVELQDEEARTAP